MLNVKELAEYLANCSVEDFGQYVWPEYGDGDRWLELDPKCLELIIRRWIDEHRNTGFRDNN